MTGEHADTIRRTLIGLAGDAAGRSGVEQRLAVALAALDALVAERDAANQRAEQAWADAAVQIEGETALAFARAEVAEGERDKLRNALRDLLAYTTEVENRYCAAVATPPYMASFPDGAKELGDRVRSLVGDDT